MTYTKNRNVKGLAVALALALIVTVIAPFTGNSSVAYAATVAAPSPVLVINVDDGSTTYAAIWKYDDVNHTYFDDVYSTTLPVPIVRDFAGSTWDYTYGSGASATSFGGILYSGINGTGGPLWGFVKTGFTYDDLVEYMDTYYGTSIPANVGKFNVVSGSYVRDLTQYVTSLLPRYAFEEQLITGSPPAPWALDRPVPFTFGILQYKIDISTVYPTEDALIEDVVKQLSAPGNVSDARSLRNFGGQLNATVTTDENLGPDSVQSIDTINIIY